MIPCAIVNNSECDCGEGTGVQTPVLSCFAARGLANRDLLDSREEHLDCNCREDHAHEALDGDQDPLAEYPCDC